jgi:hypothetical protein
MVVTVTRSQQHAERLREIAGVLARGHNMADKTRADDLTLAASEIERLEKLHKPPRAALMVPVSVSPRLLAYLQELLVLEGFGESIEQVAEQAIWARVNELIAAGRLAQLGVGR